MSALRFNPNCGACGGLNSSGFCNYTVCRFPVVKTTEVQQDTTVWIHEWIEDKNGEWGKSGRTYCEKCGGLAHSEFKYCPWCGRASSGKRTVTILAEGDMYNPKILVKGNADESL